MVIQGVPGAGKTSLVKEHAARVLAAEVNAAMPVVPVILRPSNFNAPPAALLQEMDMQIRKFEQSNEWRRAINRTASAASLLGHAVFAAMTKRNFNEFRSSAKAPDSLSVALDDYAEFRFARSDSTILFMMDEAQNLADTTRVRDYLDVLHGGVSGRTPAALACFGLANTTNRLRELGLSRIASDHIRTIGALDDTAAEKAVTDTLSIALAHYPFDARRKRWIDEAAKTILDESGNFPHHIANGCRAFARVALDEGIGDAPPVTQLRDRCREYKREYYDARLQPWAKHTVALAHAFGDDEDWVPVGFVQRALMASDDFGDPVGARDATRIIDELGIHGYLENRRGKCRPALPSLGSHLAEIRRDCDQDNDVAKAVRAELGASP